jgi:hypothetical protein
LNAGRTVASLNDEMLGASYKIDEQEARKDFLNFLVLTQVVGIHEYCPQHIQQLKDNIEASRQN